MMMYAVFDSEGLPAGFYTEAVHGDAIPEHAIAITEEQWLDFLRNPGARRWDGAAVVDYSPTPLPISGEAVNAERARRIVAGKVIDGVYVTGRAEDARNLMSLAMVAQMRIAGGDTITTTVFRDGNNVDHDLTPSQILSIWQQSAAYVSALYDASWALKAMQPIPADFAGDGYWPA